MAVTTVWAAVLISYGVFALTAMDSVSAVYPLDMAPNSVDDMYDGCNGQMKSKVDSEFLPNEKNTKDNKDFKTSWDWAGRTYENNKLGTETLGKEQFIAIVVYTKEHPRIYSDLNKAVRNQKSMYRTTFKYHALHFYLTDAIQTLRNQNGKKCYNVIRGTKSKYTQDVLNKEIRFGSFTSSSMEYDTAENFGRESCFEIETCYGADISMHSKFKDHEAEVLIPPYEVFKVTKISKKSQDQNLRCEVVYRLKSTRTLSNLNCALFPK